MNVLTLTAYVGFLSSLFVGGGILVRHDCVDDSCYAYPAQTPPGLGYWHAVCSTGDCPIPCGACRQVIVVDGWLYDSVACACGGKKESLPPCFSLFDEGFSVTGEWYHKYLGCKDNGCEAMGSACREAVMVPYLCLCGG